MTGQDEHDDPDLRQAFAALRAEDTAQPPDLERLLARPRPSRPRAARLPRLAGFAAAAAAAAVAVLLLAHALGAFRSPTPHDVQAVSVASWTAPTDFLLRTPGQDILGPLPRLGGGPAPFPLPERAERTPAPKPRSVAP